MRPFLSLTMSLLGLVLGACDREALLARHVPDPSDYEIVALIAEE